MAEKTRVRLGPKAAIIISTLLIIAFGMFYDLYWNVPDMHIVTLTKSNVQDAKPAPDFTFTDIGGTTQKLSDLRGKIVLIHFWASWCLPCLEEFPHLVKFVESHQGKVVLVALSSDSKLSDIEVFIGKQAADVQKMLQSSYMHVVYDQNRRISRDIFMTQLYPETIIVNADQKMVRKISEPGDWNNADMKNYFMTLLP